MIFHENRLLADVSYKISYLIFVKKQGKMLQNLSFAAVMIGALRVKHPVSQKRYKDRTNAEFLIACKAYKTCCQTELSCP